jgi:sulfate permease, SulP family
MHVSTNGAWTTTLQAAWLGNVRTDLLSGLVVAIALIPEAISFSIIAGVDPKVGLYAAFTIAIVISLVGGRPGMISAATGAVALLVVPLVHDHGVQYLFAAGLLAGVFQFLFGVLRVGQLMRFIPRPVMVGFVDALAVIIFRSQLPHVRGGSWVVYAIVASGVALIYLVPRATRVVPAPLIAIVALTGAALVWHLDVPTVKDMGQLPSALPSLGLPSVPFDLHTLAIVWPYSLSIAVVGLMESLMTAKLIDDITDTPSNKDKECRGQGMANVAAALVGGLPGCAMIGQSMINMQGGGRTRLSTLASGVFLLALLVVFGGIVGRIPVAALVAVMVVVSIKTFDWSSIRVATLRRAPRSETAVLAATVAIVVVTDNLAYGVGAGVLLSAFFFARRVAHLVEFEQSVGGDGTTTYAVRGQLFFASTTALAHALDDRDSLRVVIDLTHAHIWDSSAVHALDAASAKLRERGAEVEVVGLNSQSEALHGRLTGTLAASH